MLVYPSAEKKSPKPHFPHRKVVFPHSSFKTFNFGFTFTLCLRVLNNNTLTEEETVEVVGKRSFRNGALFLLKLKLYF